MFAMGMQRRPAFMTREAQIQSLKKLSPHVGESGGSTFDMTYAWKELQYTIRVELPPGFPDSMGPSVVVFSPLRGVSVQHPLLDTYGRVMTEDIQRWVPSKDLGAVVGAVLQAFAAQPPLLQQQTITPAAAAPSPMPPGAATPGTAARAGAASTSGATNGRAAVGGGVRDPLTDGFEVPDFSTDRMSTKVHADLPPIPTRFDSLSSLNLAQLQLLLEDADARAGFLSEHDAVKACDELVTAQVNSTLEAARAGITAIQEMRALGEQLQALQAEAERKRVELQALMARRAAILDRFTPPKLERELRTTATELQRMADTLAQAFTDESRVRPTDPAAAAAEYKDFRDEYIALRKRYHMANAKALLVAQGALVATPPRTAAAAGGAVST